MSYSETEEQTFYRFTDKEDAVIQEFLKSRGYKWDHNTVCGGHCGMYADEYWVGGIGGRFKWKDKKAFIELAKEKGMVCAVSGYTITADPNEYGAEYKVEE